MEASSSPSYFAILIGINAYQDKPLKGPVRDVQNIKRFLETSLSTIDIQTLIAPVEAEERSNLDRQITVLATYHNVRAALDRVTKLATKGDCVYIHYSGHGTRGDPDREFSNRSTGDLALALLDESGNIRNLWGNILAASLKGMVDLGLVVTVVLDCCFSGSAYRRSRPGARYLPENTKTGREDAKYDSDSILTESGVSGDWRDACMRPNWLIDPDGYVILAACGPLEEAGELIHKGENYGALSYILLRTLKQHGLQVSHGNLCNYLRAHFLGFQIEQNPVIYGNRDQPFFSGRRRTVSLASAPIRKEKDGTFVLEAGSAHGICDGDQLLLYPLPPGGIDTVAEGVKAVAINTRALVSQLEVLDTGRSAITIRTGWLAVPLTRLCLRKVPIRLCENVDCKDELVAALQSASLMVDQGSSEKCSLHLRFSPETGLEIFDGPSSGGFEKIQNLPPVTPSITAVRDISAVLEHLAMFKFVKDLHCQPENCAIDKAMDTISDVRIVDHHGNSFLPGDRIEVPHDERVTLVVRNKRRNRIFVYIYDMGPHWQVSGLLQATFEVIPGLDQGPPSSGEWRRKIRMKVPDDIVDRGEYQCHDIIKVIVTSVPTSFDLLELPKISKQRPHRPLSRKENSRGSCLDGDRHPPEEWAAFNFPICTVLRPSG